jgi:hypothetical protein
MVAWLQVRVEKACGRIKRHADGWSSFKAMGMASASAFGGADSKQIFQSNWSLGGTVDTGFCL